MANLINLSLELTGDGDWHTLGLDRPTVGEVTLAIVATEAGVLPTVLPAVRFNNGHASDWPFNVPARLAGVDLAELAFKCSVGAKVCALGNTR